MAAPRTHAQTESRNPAAAMTSGKVMNGPTPIISSMLKRTAERRPMRRSRCAWLAPGLDVGGGRLMRSPDCTLAKSMFFTQRVVRAAVSLAVLAGLLLSSSPIQVNAQQPAEATGREDTALPPREPSSVALPLPED